MTDKEAIGQSPAPEANAKLQAAMLASQTLGELYALMEDYSYLEFMAVYNQLPASQQAVLDKICLRDTQAQLDAINVAAHSY
jgi:hypothetical protein